MVRDATPAAAIVDDGRGGLEPSSTLSVIDLDEFEREAGRAGAADMVARGPGDDALIVYTSGTTGQPKGAVHTHASLRAGVRSMVAAWSWTPEDRLTLSLIHISEPTRPY